MSRRQAVEHASARLRVELPAGEHVRLVDLDLGNRTFTLTLDAAVALGESLGDVLVMASRVAAEQATQAALTGDPS